MVVKLNKEKEIIALSSFEALRLRPTMYVGQISPVEEKLPLIIDGIISNVEKTWSPGFMHLIVEILENALDEAKRCKGKMKNVSIEINLDNNKVAIIDQGQGFHNAGKKHPKTKKNVVRTALEELHAGSNFTDSSTNILGTHGCGSAVVNILSEHFEIETVNKTHFVKIIWDNFKVTEETIRKKEPGDKLGTKISFIPSWDIFSGFKWDEDLISTYLSYKLFLIKDDPIISKLNLNVEFTDGHKKWKAPLTVNFIPEAHIRVGTSFGSVYLWESYENSSSLSFVNGSQCTGIHQKVVNDWCNEYFQYNLAHHFYETLISLNVPSNLMRFADQNKTKFATGRGELEEQMKDNFHSKLIKLLSKSDIARGIEKAIEDRLHSENLGKIRKAQKQSKRKISDKFTPATKVKDSIYITEGLSAAGSVKQKRDFETEAVYALKGKIKNTRRLSDLSENKELLEIMSILDIEPANPRLPTYGKVIIATDEDCIHENHLVITERGNKKIKDLTYNDKILTHTGKYKNIEKIIETKKQNFIEIEINGENISCSEYHILLIVRNEKIQEIFAKDLQKSDFLLLKNE